MKTEKYPSFIVCLDSMSTCGDGSNQGIWRRISQRIRGTGDGSVKGSGDESPESNTVGTQSTSAVPAVQLELQAMCHPLGTSTALRLSSSSIYSSQCLVVPRESLSAALPRLAHSSPRAASHALHASSKRASTLSALVLALQSTSYHAVLEYLSSHAVC